MDLGPRSGGRWAAALLCVATLFLCSATARAQTPLRVDSQFDSEPLGLHMAVLRDATKTAGIDEMRAAAAQGRFEPFTREYNALGYVDDAIWLRLVVRNTGDLPVSWYLDMRYAMHDRVALYRATTDGTYRATSAGDFVPFRAWPMAHRTVVFPVRQPPGEEVLYLRVRSTNPMNLPLTAYSPASFERARDRDAIVLWLFYGIMVALLVYNAFLYAFLRDRAYLYYIGYVGSGGLFMLTHNGLAFAYLWPASPRWNNQAHVVFGVLVTMMMVQFGRSFLATRRTAPRIDRVFVGALVLAAAALLASLPAYLPLVAKLGAVLLLFIIALLFAAGIVVLRSGYRPARFYVIAWSTLLVGIGLGLLNALGLLPDPFFAEWAYQIAAVLEAVLLSVALADRINQMKREVEQLNVALEDRVNARTKSLQSTSRQLLAQTRELEAANVRLRGEIRVRQRAERERNAYEEQARQAQKMEAVGRIAGGVAHDLNNLLAVVMGYTELLRDGLDPEDPRHEDIGEILQAVERGEELTKNLLGFARRGPVRKEAVELNAVLRQVKELLDHTALKKVAVELDLDESLPPIEGDENQLTHVVMNLCLNGMDAMDADGKLTLRSATAQLGNTVAELSPGTYVRIEVADTGEGMPPDVVERACEPFFTTKPQGQGTGLGLSMAYGVVRTHGGSLSLESTVGVGTTATILLPAVSPAGQPAHTPELSVRPGAVEGQVLVVDDEDGVRKSMARMLRVEGIGVIEAANGAEAVQIYSREHDSIALVILDMMMPVMDGEATLERLKSIEPEVRVLLCSGYASEHSVKRAQKTGVAGWLAKPFDREGLLRAVSAALTR